MADEPIRFVVTDEKREPEGVDSQDSAAGLLAAVELELDRLRPALVADGGNIELLGVDSDGTARVTFQGQCATCPAQAATLRIGLEEPLLEKVPGLTGLVAL